MAFVDPTVNLNPLRTENLANPSMDNLLKVVQGIAARELEDRKLAEEARLNTSIIGLNDARIKQLAREAQLSQYKGAISRIAANYKPDEGGEFWAHVDKQFANNPLAQEAAAAVATARGLINSGVYTDVDRATPLDALIAKAQQYTTAGQAKANEGVFQAFKKLGYRTDPTTGKWVKDEIKSAEDAISLLVSPYKNSGVDMEDTRENASRALSDLVAKTGVSWDVAARTLAGKATSKWWRDPIWAGNGSILNDWDWYAALREATAQQLLEDRVAPIVAQYNARDKVADPTLALKTAATAYENMVRRANSLNDSVAKQLLLNKAEMEYRKALSTLGTQYQDLINMSIEFNRSMGNK